MKAVATALQLDITGNIAYFGSKALAKSDEAPERTFQNFKVFTGDNGQEYQAITGQDKYTPDDLASLYLSHIRKQLEEHYFNGAQLLSMAELSCVIGCPSDWSEVRKENLKRIVESAGFPKVKLCDEPIGVIYYHHFFGGLKFSKSQNILVYDFGGGTTDVAIARIEITDSGEIKPKVLAVGGLPNLGGSNFDEAILAHYMSVNNYDLSMLPMRWQLHDKWMIGLESRNVKEELSKKASVERTIHHLKVTGGAKPQKLSLSREEFMSVCAPLIERFDEPVYDTLTSAGLSADDIDAVILAGGSSAMPFVKEKMSGIFPAGKIFLSTSADIIAQGLAVYGRAELLGMKALEHDDGGNDSGTSSGHEEISPVKSRKGWAGFAAVLVIGGALAYGYTRYTAYQKEQEQARIEQERQEQLRVQAEQERIRKEREAEQERLRIAREKAEAERKQAERERLQAERERQAAERARQEAERRARQQTPQRRYLSKSAIQNIVKSYGFEYSWWGEGGMYKGWFEKGEEVLGMGMEWSFPTIRAPYVMFTDRKVAWRVGDNRGRSWTYNQLRNSVTDSQIRSELRHLPNAQNVINAVLEIKYY